MSIRRCVVIAVAIILTTACSQPEARGENSNAGSDQQAEATVQETSATIDVDDDELALRQQLPEVVERVMPSVVGITTERTIERRGPGGRSPFGDLFREFGPGGPPGDQQERRREDVGSGVIVDDEGVVITNHHVIDNADTIRVNLDDGRELETEIVGSDPDSDIAVLRITDVPDDLEAIEFGDSDQLRLGETVIAIGNPFGLSGTVTMGIISAKGRADVGILDYENFIQTDAAINPGNSGGALINLDGELVGINTAILSRTGGHQGVGFAIPSNMANMVTTSLLEEGYVERGWLGVVIQDLTPELAAALEVDADLEGVLISDVQEGSPAGEHGLERGDVVTHVDGERVTSSQELRNNIGLRSPDEDVDLQVVREGDSREVVVTLGVRDDDEIAQRRGVQPEQPEEQTAIEGLQMEPVDGDLRRQYELPDQIARGLVVTGIERGTEAMGYEFREGDVILEVNRQTVGTVDEFNAVYDDEQPQNLFFMYRDGTTVFMTQ